MLTRGMAPGHLRRGTSLLRRFLPDPLSGKGITLVLDPLQRHGHEDLQTIAPFTLEKNFKTLDSP